MKKPQKIIVGITFLSTTLGIGGLVMAQEDFDTTGLTLVEENIDSDCGEVYSTYHNAEGELIIREVSNLPTVAGISIFDLRPSDLSNHRVHFDAQGNSLLDSVEGRNEASERIITYAERQLFTFHKTNAFALRDFGVWYRARQQADVADELSKNILKALVKTAIKTTLKYTVPGAKEVVSLVGDIAKNVYEPAVDSVFASGSSDPSVALDRLADRFADQATVAQIGLNTLVSTTSNQRRREVWDNAVKEYIVDSICSEVDEDYRRAFGATGTVGAVVAEYLGNLGLPVNMTERKQARTKFKSVKTLVYDTLRAEAQLALVDDYHAYDSITSPATFPRGLNGHLVDRIKRCLDQRSTQHAENILGTRTHSISENSTCAHYITDQ